MPGYLKKLDASRINDQLHKVAPLNSTELTHAIERLVLNFLEPRPLDDYSLNEALGALEAAKQEFIERIVKKYNAHKIQSGDHYHDFIRSKNF